MEFAAVRCIFKVRCLSNTAPRKDLSVLKLLFLNRHCSLSNINIIEVLVSTRKLSPAVLLSAIVYGLIEATLVYQCHK